MQMSADKKQILICGNYGAGNLGDEAILDGILRLVDTTWPNSEATVLSARPFLTHREHNIHSVNLFPAGLKSIVKFWFGGQCLRSIKALTKTDLIILGGGGLFTDEKWQAVWIWFVQTWWFWLFRKRLVCIAQSIGPLETGLGKYLTRKVFRRAVYISVRDKKSLLTLKDLGITNAKLLSDAAFALAYEHGIARNIQDQVVLSLRAWPAERQQSILSAIAKSVDWLWATHKLKTLFIPFQEQGQSDIAQYQKIQKLIHHSTALQLKVVEDYKQAMEIIGRSKFVLGMRLHSLIFATMEGRPFVALSYSTKVHDLMSDLKMSDFTLDYNKINFKVLSEIINNLLSRQHDLSDHLTKEKMKNTYRFFEHEKALKLLL